MSLHGDCPVCGKRPFQPVFKEFVIHVALRGHPEHQIGGLRAYQCEQEQHIFFVLGKDVELTDGKDPSSSQENQRQPPSETEPFHDGVRDYH